MNESLTIEKFRQMKKELENICGPAPLFTSPYNGYQILESPYLTKTETYEVTEPRTFWQRWIEPISTFKNFQTMPFEPWIKTKKVIRTRTVPLNEIMVMNRALVIHPIMRSVINSLQVT